MTGTNIQEQPESTVGRKPPHRPPPRPPPRKGTPAPTPTPTPERGEPFARYRVRREEAEESDLGSEIRDRDEEGPAERGVVEVPAWAPPPEGKPSVP